MPVNRPGCRQAEAVTEVLVVTVTALVVIAAATVVGPRLGIAAPLVLVAIGVAASFLPVFSATHIEPEWILEGVLPPLLYSSAVSMPAMNFRREFGAISGLSVLLVVDPQPGDFLVVRNHRLAVIAAQRSVLLDARDNGIFNADVLANALANLDATEIATEIATEMRGTLAG
jgi:hypothetical protein